MNLKISSGWKRKLPWLAGAIVLLPVLSLILLHIPPIQRLVFSQIQIRLRNTQRVLIDVRTFDYNLLLSRFSLEGVTVRSVEDTLTTPILKANKIAVRFGIWELLRGSLFVETAKIDGLELHWLRSQDGRSNFQLKTSEAPRASSFQYTIPLLPVRQMEITNASITLQDETAHWGINLPAVTIHLVSKSTEEHQIEAIARQPGRLRWMDREFPIDFAALELIHNGQVLEISSFKVGMADSTLLAHGRLKSLDDPQLKISTEVNLNAEQISRWIKLTPPISGQATVKLDLSRADRALVLDGWLESNRLALEKALIGPVKLSGQYDISAGTIHIEDFRAGAFSGLAKGDGSIALGGRDATSSLNLNLNGLDLHEIALSQGWKFRPQGKLKAQLKVSWPKNLQQQIRITVVGLTQVPPIHGKAESSPIRFAIESQFQNSHLHNRILSISLPDTEVQGDLDINTRKKTLEGSLSADSSSIARSARKLEDLFGKHPGEFLGLPIDGPARLRAVLSGSLDNPSVSMHVDSQDMQFAQVKNLGLQVQANYLRDRVQLESAELRWRDSVVAGSGEIGLSPATAPIRISGHLRDLSVPDVLEEAGIVTDVHGLVSGDITMDGTASKPVLQMNLQSGSIQAYGELLGKLSSEITFAENQLNIGRLLLNKPQPQRDATVEGQGSVDFKARTYQFNIESRDIQAISFRTPAGSPLRGSLYFKAVGSSTLDNPSGQLSIEGKDLRLEDLELGDVSAGVKLADHRAAVSVKAQALQVEAEAEISTLTDYPFQFSISADRTPLTRFRKKVDLTEGILEARIQGKGLLSAPGNTEASASVKTFEITTRGQTIRSQDPFEIQLKGRRFALSQLTFVTGGSSLKIHGDFPIEQDGTPGSINLNGSLDLDSLNSLLPYSDRYTLSGNIQLEAELLGNRQKLSPRGTLHLRNGKFQSKSILKPVEDLTGDFIVRDGLFKVETLSAKLDAGSLRLSGSSPLSLIPVPSLFSSISVPQPAEFSFAAEKFSLSSFVHLPANVSGSFDVQIQGQADSLSLNSLRARAEFGQIQLKGEKYVLQQTVPTLASIKDAKLKVEQFHWSGPQTELRADGTADFSNRQELDFHLSGNADASVLALFNPYIQGSGPVRLDLSAKGSVREPDLTGFVEAERARVGVRSPRLLAEDLDLRIELTGNQILLKRLRGSLNGGPLIGSGSVGLKRGKLEDVNLEISGNDVFLDYPTGLRTTSQLAVKIYSQKDLLVLGGTVEIAEGSFHEPFPLGELSITGEPASQNNEGNLWLGKKVRFDFKCKTKQPIDIDNNLARFSASADLHLVGDVQKPGLLGTIQLEPGGKLYFGDRVYYAERGVVNFTNQNRIDPLFDILASTRVKDYEINLRLTGTIKETQTTFTSDPPLSRDDIISVLLTGKTLAESGGKGIDPAQAGKMSLVSSALSAGMSGKIRSSVGISQVTIEPGLIAAESDPGARLTIGQDLTRSLRLVYSMNLANSKDQIWILEYDLRRRFVMRGVQQEDNTYRAEFRHDVRFGGPSKIDLGIAPTRKAKPRIGSIKFSGETIFPEAKLAGKFKMHVGDKYEFLKARKGIDRLKKFYSEEGYLEARVFLQTDTTGEQVRLQVEIEPGPTVKIDYTGAKVPNSVEKKVLVLWQEGVSDLQRIEECTEAIRVHFVDQKYAEVEVRHKISVPINQEKSVSFEIQQGPRYNRIDTVFEGASPQFVKDLPLFLRQRRLESSLTSNPIRVADAIRRHYQQQGYLLVKVETPHYDLDPVRKSGKLILRIQEGPLFRVDTLRFKGNKALNEEELRKNLPLTAGSIFDPTKLEPSLGDLRDKYGRRGYQNAEIDYTLIRNDTKGLVTVEYGIEEKLKSVVNSVKIEGQDYTSEKFIRRQLGLVEGKEQDAREIQKSVQNLYRTGAFSRVDIEAKPIKDSASQAKDIEAIDVVIKVQEARPYKIIYGGYYDSERGPGAIADFENRNTLGGARVLGSRGRYDREFSEGRFYVTQPPLRQFPLNSTLSSYLSQEVKEKIYDVRTSGVSFQQEAYLLRNLLISYGYRYEKKSALDLTDPTLPPFRYSLSPLTTSVSYSTRDDYLDPTKGFFTSSAFEYGPEALGNTYGYVRYFGQYFKYFPISKPAYAPFWGESKRSRFVYATGIRVGLLKGLTRDDVVPTERFFAGGGTTVRGFKQDELGPKDANGTPIGGNALLVLNNEIRFPFISILDAVGFVDIGNVYPLISDFKFSELRKTSGIGLRLRTPFFMLRFDYGFKLDRQPGESRGAFFFSIGQAF